MGTGALGDGSSANWLPRGTGCHGTYEAGAELELHAASSVIASMTTTPRMSH
jgi:hypothetical protein